MQTWNPNTYTPHYVPPPRKEKRVTHNDEERRQWILNDEGLYWLHEAANRMHIPAIKLLVEHKMQESSTSALNYLNSLTDENGIVVLPRQKEKHRKEKSDRKRRKAKGAGPLPGEVAYVRNVEEFGQEKADRMADS